MNKNACRAVVEGNLDGIMVVDKKGVVRFANPAAISLFGRGAEGLLNQELGCPQVAGEATEVDIVHKSGLQRVVELRTTDIEWEEGKEEAFLISLRDITDRLILLERLHDSLAMAEASHRSKSCFLSNMSHELRTPLNAVIGFSDLLLSGNMGALNKTQEEFLRDVLGNGRQLLRKINDILDLAELESGDRLVRRDPFVLRPFLENTLSAVRDEAMARGVSLTLDCPEWPEPIQSDPRMLGRVLLNLLKNAVLHTLPGGNILLEAKPHGQGLEKNLFMAVHDTGMGLDDKDLQRLFQPFEPLENGKSPLSSGIGVGLAMAHKMMELLGGRIWAESPGPGLGSSFHVELPIAG